MHKRTRQKKSFLFQKRTKKSGGEGLFLRFSKVAMVITMCLSIVNFSTTNAFYNDFESSENNVFSAGFLDFRLTNNNLEKNIGPEALGEISHASVAMPEDGSLPMQYVLNTLVATTSDIGFCDGLVVEAKNNGMTKYYGGLSGLFYATTTEFGTWEFRLDLPPTASVSHGVQCNASAVFYAWRADIVDPANSGWYDEETLDISLTARMVVLNEIYANPSGGATPPKNREYVELYNNGSTPVDVLGWKISEISGTSTEKFYTIVASTTSSTEMQPFGGSTVVPAGGFMVLVFNTEGASYFNNTGDTVKLYGSDSVLFDAYSYPSTATGKSHVRYPDGIGYWVDPEPTPGEMNKISYNDLITAGFDEATISKILALAELRSAPAPTDNVSEQTVLTENEIPVIVEEVPEEVATTTEEVFEIISEDLLSTTTPEIISENVTETASTTAETIEEQTNPDVVISVISEPVAIPPVPELVTETEEGDSTPESEPAPEPEPVVESVPEPAPEPVVEAVIPEPVPVTESTN